MADQNVETLFETPWLALKKRTLPEHNAEYIFSHSKATDGHAVAILPFRSVGGGDIEYLLRREIVPPWDHESFTVCSITGGHDQETYLDTACKELKEETGYEVSPEQFHDLGTCRISKASDTTYHLFAIDLTGIIRPDTPKGDGSSLEDVAESFWGGHEDMMGSPDALLHVMALRGLLGGV